MLTASERNYLLNSMRELLEEYDYDYSYEATEKILDEWARQKAGLIEAFKKHPNYVEGQFMIAFDADYERKVETHSSNVFKAWVLYTAVPAMEGKFPEEVQEKVWNGNYLPQPMWDFFYYLQNYAERCISESTANYINNTFPTVHAHPGQKTSRVVNKICCYLGLDKVDGYNREFAKYADSLSPMVIKRHTILSINPLDYLTMSFGNSWASCHTIDTNNKRGMPNSYRGCYSSGTVSYMLDEVSMVLYTVDASYDGNEYWNQPKINRQMFHYAQEKLVQSRLYPQDNDGDDAVYTPYRVIVQDIISKIFDFPNLWTLKRGVGEVCPYIFSNGTNYPDYAHFKNVTISRIKGSENDGHMKVGAPPICVSCGCRHSISESIDCCHNDKYVCEACGEYLDEDDVIWINGESYCRDCCEYCDCCEEYHRGDSHHVRGYGQVCNGCIDNFYYCEECGEYMNEEYLHYIEHEDRYVCNDCLDRYYTRCEMCNEYFRDDEVRELEDGTHVCQDCYDEQNCDEDEEDC